MSLEAAVLQIAQAMDDLASEVKDKVCSLSHRDLLSFARELRTAVKAAERSEPIRQTFTSAQDYHEARIREEREKIRRGGGLSLLHPLVEAMEILERESPPVSQLADGSLHVGELEVTKEGTKLVLP